MTQADTPGGRWQSAEGGRPPWERLTVIPEKARAYAVESYFREAWADAERTWGDRTTEHLHALATMVFKPDAVVSRRIDDCSSFLRTHGFVPVAFERLRFDRHMSREVWRFQSNAATLDRLAVIDLLLEATDSLLVVYRSDAVSPIPATMRLRALKGNPARGDLPADGLRAVCRSPHPILSIVHSPDEPADLVREWGILLDPAQRERLLHAVGVNLRTGCEPALEAAVRALYADAEEVFLNPAESMTRLKKTLDDGPVDDVTVGLRDVLHNSADAKVPLRGFLAMLDASGIPLSVWDRIGVGVQVAQLSKPDARPIINASDADRWYASE